MLKFIRPDMNTIPTGIDKVTIHAVVKDALAEKWLSEIGDTPWKIIVEDCNEFVFDCGGCVGIHEPFMEYQLDEWKISCRLRHAEILKEYCNKIHTNIPNLGEFAYLPGHWVKAILTVETANKINNWLAAELPRRISELDQLEAKHQAALQKAGVITYPKK